MQQYLPPAFNHDARLCCSHNVATFRFLKSVGPVETVNFSANFKMSRRQRSARSCRSRTSCCIAEKWAVSPDCETKSRKMPSLVPRFPATLDPRLLFSIRTRISHGFKVRALAVSNSLMPMRSSGRVSEFQETSRCFTQRSQRFSASLLFQQPILHSVTPPMLPPRCTVPTDALAATHCAR